MDTLLTLEMVTLVNGLAIQHSSEWEDYLEMNAQLNGMTKEEYAAYYLGTQWQMQCMESLQRLTEKKVTRKQLDKAINDVAAITDKLKKVVKEWAAARDAGKTEKQEEKLQELKKLNDDKAAAQKVVDDHIQQLDKNATLQTTEDLELDIELRPSREKMSVTIPGDFEDNEGEKAVEDELKNQNKEYRSFKVKDIKLKESMNEAKKYNFKAISNAWQHAYGEDMKDEYHNFHYEVTTKYNNKVTKEEIAKIWMDIYGEDMKDEYDGFFNSIKEAKFVNDFNREVLKAKTKEEVSKLYPSAEFYIGKSDHFFGELQDNLFFKAYYTKGQKEFRITSVYSQKGKNYMNLYLNESVNEKKSEFKEGDKVKLTLKGLQQMNRHRTPGISNNYSRSLGKIRDKDIVGTVERVFPSGSMNVDFDGVLYDIKDYMVVKESVNEDKSLKDMSDTDLIATLDHLKTGPANIRDLSDKLIKNIEKEIKRRGIKESIDEKYRETRHQSTDFSKPGNDGDIYFSKREGSAVGIKQGDKLQMIYVFQKEPKLGKIQKSDKRWENMGPASEKLLVDLRGREEGKIMFDFVSNLKESVNEAVSRSTKIYCVATPAPREQLVEELENIFGDDYRHIVTEFTDDEGYESVLLFNLTKNDIASIQKRVADVLIWEYSIKKGKEIMESMNEKIKVASLADAIDAERDGDLNKKHLDKILKRKEDGTIHQMTGSEEKTYHAILRKYKIEEAIDMDMINTEYGFWGTMADYEDEDSLEIAYEDAMNYLIGAYNFTQDSAYNFLNSKWGRKLADEYYDGTHYNMVDAIEAFGNRSTWKKYAKMFSEAKENTMKNLLTLESFTNEAMPKYKASKEEESLIGLRDEIRRARKGGAASRYTKEFDAAKKKALKAVEDMIMYAKIGV